MKPDSDEDIRRNRVCDLGLYFSVRSIVCEISRERVVLTNAAFNLPNIVWILKGPGLSWWKKTIARILNWVLNAYISSITKSSMLDGRQFTVARERDDGYVRWNGYRTVCALNRISNCLCTKRVYWLPCTKQIERTKSSDWTSSTSLKWIFSWRFKIKVADSRTSRGAYSRTSLAAPIQGFLVAPIKIHLVALIQIHLVIPPQGRVKAESRPPQGRVNAISLCQL